MNSNHSKYIILLIFNLLLLNCHNESDITNHLADHEVNIPELFLPGIVSDLNLQEFSLTLSPIDAKTIFFTRRLDENSKQRIYETNYVDGNWTAPKIASFSNDRDESPSFSRNGNVVYFGSERPLPNQPNLGNFDMNVWKTMWNGKSWSEPVPLSNIINKVQIEDEKWPSSNMSHFVTSDDVTFYTGTQVRGTKGLDIYKTTYTDGNFSELEKLSKSINKEDKWEYAPVISPEGDFLFTQVYNREDGLGGDDIFVSMKNKNGDWLPSVNLGNLINTNMNECPAEMSADGKYFFFTRDMKENPEEYDGIASIYFIETKALNLNRLFK